MIEFETNIDTIALQIDCQHADEQRTKLTSILDWIRGKKIGMLETDYKKNNKYSCRYNLYFGKRLIATICSGSTKNRNKVTGVMMDSVFYIRIRFAGLKSHNVKADKTSYESLVCLCAYLNTTGTNYKFTELDIALDVFCPFDNILAFCINKASHVNYNPIGYKQYFNYVPTSYIEDYSNAIQKNNAVLRAYFYNKGKKEGLPFSISRFEIKLQNRFFLQNGFSYKSISKACNKYFVMYFKDVDTKNLKIEQCMSHSKITQNEVTKFRLNRYRLYFDLSILENFVMMVKKSYVDFYGNIIVPKLYDDIFV